VPTCDDIFRRFDKIVYIVRDPRDVVVSASKYNFTPFMLAQHPQQEPDAKTFLKHRLYEQVFTWVQHIGGYLLHTDEYRIHFVFYERLLHDFDNEYGRLLHYLGFTLPPAALAEVRENSRFESMKKQNPHHLRKGESGGWVRELTTDQARWVVKIAGPMMALTAYRAEPPGPGDQILPEITDRLSRDQIQQAISAARGGIPDRLHYAWAFFTSRRPLGEKLRKGMEFLWGKGRWSPDP
jgi:aryl sulfotransferase